MHTCKSDWSKLSNLDTTSLLISAAWLCRNLNSGQYLIVPEKKNTATLGHLNLTSALCLTAALALMEESQFS